MWAALANCAWITRHPETTHSVDPMRSRARAYRWDKLRRAFTRTAENNAPAPPTSASTAVGFSGQ